MKKSKLVMYIAVSLIVLSLMMTLFLDDDLAQRITTIITMVTAVIGAVALFVQYQRDKDVNQANFIVSYAKYFHEIDGCDEIFAKIEKYQDGQKNIFKPQDQDAIVRYLVWCEELSVLIQKKIMDLSLVDNLFSYNFFLIVNNDYVQNLEIVPYAEYYKGLYALHKMWVDYKKETNQPILNEEFGLEKTPDYIVYCKKGNIKDTDNY